MAYSGNIGTTTFNALKVVDHAYRRCRLTAQQITSEMHTYALESLYVLLSELASIKTPSWCIEKVVLPMYENQPLIPLPVGTVEVMNMNYRVLQPVSGVETTASTSYTVSFSSETTVDIVGIRWLSSSVPVTFQVSDDNVTWVTVGSSETSANAGETTWTDLSGSVAHSYFRVTSVLPLSYAWIVLGNMPQEIPLGALNKDTYVAQSNKVFPGRPNSYWFQRKLPNPVVNLWPAPFAAAQYAQLIVWRHRAIMNTENLQQDVEIPERWLEAIITGLASKVAAETPQVDITLVPALEQKYMMARQIAFDGDNDGSPTFIQPNISGYTR